MRKLAIMIVFLGLSFGAMAQSVGLALSGGGAKGLYHIGVIKALEDNDIPIDYISGTSMGSIIGGLYAIGYTPEQMREEFLSPQIMNWLTGQLDDKYVYYYKSMRRNASMVNLRLDLARKRGQRMPSNLVSSTQLDMAFVEYFSAAETVCGGDFDKLVVPFRCVASDLAGRREVVFRDGDLGMAIRASMSIPLMYKPVRKDSMLLSDGGLFNNFPWQILDSDFKPDIIIGSKCVEGHRNPDKNSMIDQVFALTNLSTDYTLPEGRSVMIDRIFDEISMMDFDKAEIIIQFGYDDALARMDQIKSLVQRRSDPVELAARRARFKAAEPELVFDDYRFTGLGLRQGEYVRKALGLDDKEDTTYTFDEFRDEYYKMMSEKEFDSSYPTVEYDSTKRFFSLSLPLHTRPSFRVMIGGNISSTALNQAYVGLEYKQIGRTAQSYNLDGYFSPFYTSVTLGSRVDFFKKAPFYYQWAGSYNFYNYFRSNYGFISKGRSLTYAKKQDAYLMMAIGMPLGRRSVLTLRAHGGQDDYRYYQTPTYVEDDKFDHTRFRYAGANLVIERNSIPNVYSNRGLRQNLSVIGVTGREYYVPGENFSGLEVRDNAKRLWWGTRLEREEYFAMKSVKWFSLGYLFEGTYTNHPNFFNDYATNISSPAFTPTPHSRIVYMKEYRSSSYLALGVMPSFDFTNNFYLKCSAYAFLPDNIDGNKEGIKQRLRYIFDASLVYQTFIGPVSLSLSKYDVNRNNWFLTFNFGYAIFNKKGIFY